MFNRLPTAVVVTPPSDPVFAPAADETFYSDGEGVSGEWGIVYTDRILPFAYKVFFTGPFNKQGYSDETCRLAYLKSLFKEVIIQTFLQTDRAYGHHICNVHKLYRNGNRGLLKMDKLEISLKYIIEEETEEEGGPIRSTRLLLLLVKLFEILIYFYTKYNFQHNDLHAGNVMTVAAAGDKVANLALIDFGNSNVTIGDVEIEDSSHEDFNVLFAHAPIHVSDTVTALFETLAALPQETSYETYLHKIMETLLNETAWESAFDILGASIVDTRAQFKTDFNAALARAIEEGLPAGGLQEFIEEYVVNYRSVLRLRAGPSRRSRSRKMKSRRKTGSRK